MLWFSQCQQDLSVYILFIQPSVKKGKAKKAKSNNAKKRKMGKIIRAMKKLSMEATVGIKKNTDQLTKVIFAAPLRFKKDYEPPKQTRVSQILDVEDQEFLTSQYHRRSYSFFSGISSSGNYHLHEPSLYCN